MCCNDVLELVRSRTCPPVLYGLNIPEREILSYSMASHALSVGGPLGVDNPCKIYSVAHRGWLTVLPNTVAQDLVFIEPGKSARAMPHKCCFVSGTQLNLIEEALVSMSVDNGDLVVSVEDTSFVASSSRCQRFNATRFFSESTPHAWTMASFERNVLLVWWCSPAPHYAVLDVDSDRLVRCSSQLSEDLNFCAKPLSVHGPHSKCVEMWTSDGCVSLYDARQNDWNLFRSGSQSMSRLLESVESVDDNLVACSVLPVPDRILLKFYDRRAMSFIDADIDSTTEKYFLRVVCV